MAEPAFIGFDNEPTSDYTFYREPLAHQRRIFERFKSEPYFALFMEQRTGKTKIVLDIFARYVNIKYLDTLIVIAYPNGVHRVFLDEMVKDLSPEMLANTKALAWRSSRMGTREMKAALAETLTHPGPVIFTINCEAIKRADSAWDHLVRLIKKRRCMVVADESSWAANFTGQTERLLTLGGFKAPKPNVLVKAILDGTPVEENPGEIYYPTTFLKRGLLGFQSALAFRARYYEYEMTEQKNPDGSIELVRKKEYNRRTNTEYDVFKGYRNIEELTQTLSSFSERVLRSDVSDAPPKVYQKRYFQLTLLQRQAYDRLRKEYRAEIAGQEFEARDVLTRMLRLQMVARNYWPPEKIGVFCPRCEGNGIDSTNEDCPRCEGLGIVVETTELARIDTRNPTIDALRLDVEANRGPIAVWCRFRQEVSDCIEALRAIGREVGRFDGSIPEGRREAAYQAFRAGEIDTLVATLGSGLTRGRDLTRADVLIYYSNDFSLRKRRQSEDRAEHLARTRSTGIVDLVAEDTRDEDIVASLVTKRSIAERVMGDPPTAWL